MKPQSASEERRYFKIKRWGRLDQSIIILSLIYYNSFLLFIIRRHFSVNSIRSMAAIKRVLSERHKIIRTQRQHEVTSAVGEPSVNISSDDNYNNEQVSKTT